MDLAGKFTKMIKYSIALSLLILVLITVINLLIVSKSRGYIYADIQKIPNAYTAIVLGALVSNNGQPSDFLKDRMDVAIELYKNKKIKRFLLSGDHGRVDYDEVNAMKNYLISKGIDTKDIFLDHAGFDTYNSMTRAKEIFRINDAIVVSQEFHLSRAVYLARSKGITAYGIKADKRKYTSIKRLRIREVFANVKAFIEVLINKRPHFSGNQIPITGDSRLSYD